MKFVDITYSPQQDSHRLIKIAFGLKLEQGNLFETLSRSRREIKFLIGPARSGATLVANLGTRVFAGVHDYLGFRLHTRPAYSRLYHDNWLIHTYWRCMRELH